MERNSSIDVVALAIVVDVFMQFVTAKHTGSDLFDFKIMWVERGVALFPYCATADCLSCAVRVLSSLAAGGGPGIDNLPVL